MRVRYTARRKRGLVATSKCMIAEGMTLRAAAAELRVSVANLSRWTSQGMGEINRLYKILRSKKKAAHTGLSGQLRAVEDGLLRYIFEKREQGIEISTFTVVLRASFLSPEFREKRCRNQLLLSPFWREQKLPLGRLFATSTQTSPP
jgi:hypothetical protein